jgi:hypothetical protein
LLICVHRLCIYLVTMNTFCTSYPNTDLAWIHYVIFIELITVSLDEAMSFHSEQFTDNSMNKLIEAKIKQLFVLFKEHFFASGFVYRKSYEVQFDDLSNEDLEFFSEP